MVTINAFRRPLAAAILPAALSIVLAAGAARAQEPQFTDEEIIKAKCTLCHSAHRVYRMAPDEIRTVLQRMRALNPDLLAETQVEQIAAHLAKILKDPNAVAMREAWVASVARGKDLFNGTSLGTTGKGCFSCHSAGSLRNVEDAYPKFDVTLKRFVDLQEAINIMIEQKLKGTPLPPNDQKYFDLLAYIRTLK